jgi:RNA polymerase sigma-70 factor (ECF subfamily)
MAAVGQQTLVGSVDTARLYELHYRRVLSYCLWRLGKREDAEDATQTTFLNAHRALSGGTTPESESSWLLTIANNVCLGRWRSQKCRPPELAAEPEALAAHAAPEHDHQLVGHLQAALAGLPEVQRRAFVLREWQGLSYAEIATELETTETAVAALVFRARRSLAETLADERAPSRAGVALNATSLLGWLKSLFGGTAAKLAVAGAVVGAAGIAAGVPLGQHQKPVSKTKARVRTPSAAVAKQTARRGPTASVSHEHAQAAAKARSPQRRSTAPTAPAGPRQTDSPPASQAPPAPSTPPADPASGSPAPPSPSGSAPISVPVPSPPSVSETATGVAGAVQQLVPQVPTIAPPSLPPAPSVPQVLP